MSGFFYENFHFRKTRILHLFKTSISDFEKEFKTKKYYLPSAVLTLTLVV
jgi:hypothetical protein